MKIAKIEKEGCVYLVTRTPNCIERFFGVKERVYKYKATGESYVFGGGNVYIDEKGRTLENASGYGSATREKIDRWRRSF